MSILCKPSIFIKVHVERKDNRALAITASARKSRVIWDEFAQMFIAPNQDACWAFTQSLGDLEVMYSLTEDA